MSHTLAPENARWLDIRLELNINPVSVHAAAEMAAVAEELRFAQVGVWDSPSLYREPWVTLAAIALRTTSVRIGVAVTNCLTRHPLITASAAAALDELAPGRVYVGVGTGDSGVYNAGYSASSAARMREYVETVRALLCEGVAEFGGRRVILRSRASHPIPIYIAAHGAKSLRVAGEVGDGAFVGLGLTAEVIRSARQVLSEAAAGAGRDPAKLDVWWASAGVHIDERPEAAARDAGWVVLVAAHHLARFTMRGKFVPPEYEDPIRELGRIYDISTHGAPKPEQRAEYVAAAQRLGVYEYLLERFLIVGPSEEVRARFVALAEAGATQFSFDAATGGTEQLRAAAAVVDGLRRHA